VVVAPAPAPATGSTTCGWALGSVALVVAVGEWRATVVTVLAPQPPATSAARAIAVRRPMRETVTAAGRQLPARDDSTADAVEQIWEVPDELRQHRREKQSQESQQDDHEGDHDGDIESCRPPPHPALHQAPALD
jgi:hypothetical protein